MSFRSMDDHPIDARSSLTCSRSWLIYDTFATPPSPHFTFTAQEIPWADQPLEYVQKFRFYYQPYNASYHTDVKRTTWGIASPVEYDVPKCSAGITGCSQGRLGSALGSA